MPTDTPSSCTQQWLSKLKQFNKLQKSTIIHYTILKTLSQSFQQSPCLPCYPIFQSLLQSLPIQIKSLSLYKQLVYKIWLSEQFQSPSISNQQYSLKIRQQCTPQITKIITDWIMIFQINVDSLKKNAERFRFLNQFIIQKILKCKNKENNKFNAQEYVIVIIDQIYQDLKDFFDQEFWMVKITDQRKNRKSGSEKSINGNNSKKSINTINSQESIKDNNIINKQPHLTIQQIHTQPDDTSAPQILQLLQLLLFLQISPIPASPSQQFYISTKSIFLSLNYHTFILTLIHYCLHLPLTQSQQSYLTSFSLQFLKSTFCINHVNQSVYMVKCLMIRTKKSVRYAMVEEYMQVYQFFNDMEKWDIVEELEQMVYFRELIVGRKAQIIDIKDTNIINNTLQIISQHYFHNIFIKPGTKQRIFISFQDTPPAILKFQLHLQPSMTITLKFYHISNQKQILYHIEQKTSLRRLQLKLMYSGLYVIQFDNVYSWMKGKKWSIGSM